MGGWTGGQVWGAGGVVAGRCADVGKRAGGWGVGAERPRQIQSNADQTYIWDFITRSAPHNYEEPSY